MPETILRSAVAEPPGPVLVGFSGGLDSTVLLHVLACSSAIRARGLRAIHVHHGLHPDASAWAGHCLRVCEALGLGLSVVEVSVPMDLGLGLEAAAREARHGAFAAHLLPGETLALAHHQDDQAETVLLRLLRASGSDGLAAIRQWRPFADGWLWRPLLALPRARLLAYAQAQQLRWIEDPSNAGHAPDRNFLRHRILPVLGERWPEAGAALARSAALLTEDAELLGAEARKRLELVRGPEEEILMVDALLELDPRWRSRVLREWIGGLHLPPLPGHALDTIDSQFLTAASDGKAEYRWAGAVLRRWRDWLHAEAWSDPMPDDWSVAWTGAQPLLLPTGDVLGFESSETRGASMLDAATIESALGTLRVAARQGGERIALLNRQHSHSLKHCLQEADIPPWQRRRLPLLFAGDGELLAAGDRIVSSRLERFCRQLALRLRWTG